LQIGLVFFHKNTSNYIKKIPLTQGVEISVFFPLKASPFLGYAYNISMYLIVGLGNPGEKFEKTRHNAGFLALEAMATGAKWENDKYSDSLLAKAQIGGQLILLCKPQTFMNESGRAVQAVLAKRGGLAENTLVVICDDLDSNPGEIKLRNGEFAKGHNGLKSIIAHVGHNFLRVGIGVGRPEEKGSEAQHVLKSVSGSQQALFEDGIKKAVEAVTQLIANNKISWE